MNKEIIIQLTDNSKAITVPFSTQIPITIDSYLNSPQALNVGVNNFPLFEDLLFPALEAVIKPVVTMRLIAQALIITLDPHLIVDMDTETIAAIDIGRDEIYHSTS